jgi:hypothetical protein
MATSNTGTRTETSYEFDLSHRDVVDMMNDPSMSCSRWATWRSQSECSLFS